MKVISQGGKIDVPYKIATIFKIGNTILARNDRTEFELAEYSTEVANKEPFNNKGGIRKQAGGYIWKLADESEVM